MKLNYMRQKLLATSTLASFTSLSFLSFISSGCRENTTEAPYFLPLPVVELSPLDTTELDLDNYVIDPDTDVSLLTFSISSDPLNIVTTSFDNETHILTINSNATSFGNTILEITAKDPDANSAIADLSVSVNENIVNCETTFTYDSNRYGSVSSVSVAGEFNSWSSTSNTLTNSGDGIYKTSINLPAGNYQYKFVTNGSNWIFDQSNPYRSYLGEYENSEVHVADCNSPSLDILDLTTDSSGNIDLFVKFTKSATKSEIDTSSIVASIGDLEVEPVYDSTDDTLYIKLSNLDQGKHSLRIQAKDQLGNTTNYLYIPIWIEQNEFDWNQSSLYFAMTDRFLDNDKTNNMTIQQVPTQSNYQGGDYSGIIKKIEEGYFSSIGVSVLWISPQIDNPNYGEYGDDGRLYSGYHGYWPTSEKTTESIFGNSATLKTLIKTAHDNGIRIIFDLVSNHVHDTHPYWTNHQNDNWFNSYDLCINDNGYERNPIGCWFAEYLPDLNYKNADTIHAMAKLALDILIEYDIDGYRVDAVKHVDKTYLYHLAGYLHEFIDDKTSSKDIYLVGETFTGQWSQSCDNTASCAQWLISDYIDPNLMDGQFDFPLYWQILTTFARNESTMTELGDILTKSQDYYGDNALMVNFLGNHDVARFISHANGDISDMWGSSAKEQGWTNPPSSPSSYVPYQKLQLAFAFLNTIKGVPFIYYGDEFGMPGAGDPDNRRMMKFSTNYSYYEEQTKSYLNSLMSIRANHSSLKGNLNALVLGSDNDFLAYGKTSTEEKAIVILNKSASPKQISLSVGSMNIKNGTTLTDAISGNKVTITSGKMALTLPSYTASIWF